MSWKGVQNVAKGLDFTLNAVETESRSHELDLATPAASATPAAVTSPA